MLKERLRDTENGKFDVQQIGKETENGNTQFWARLAELREDFAEVQWDGKRVGAKLIRSRE